LIIYFWKEYGFIEAGGVLKGDEFHGLSIFGMYCLASYKPSNGVYCFSYMGVNIASLEKIQVFQDIFISVKRMVSEMKARFLSFAKKGL
jgi:hypothetical protein